MEKVALDVILSIQKKINIVDVISEYLPITRRGKNYFAICPFHDDHNPSMSISPEKQIYTCFVCGASGNVFNFVMNYEKISFIEAVNKLAFKVGIDLNISTKEKKVVTNSKYDKYYDMFDITNKYYQNNLKSSLGKRAIKYLNERNITDELINEFNIGLSLNDNNISNLLVKKGYLKEDLIDIGLCGLTNDFLYDIFRNRIMFPLHDENGKVVGFSGRIYNNEDENKYVNSKESYIFKKGKLLYNYQNAKKYANQEKRIIVVEGFMDVIRLYTIGIKNVVATMGTAITKEHTDLIKRLSKNVILCFDGDKAGEKATISALKLLEESGISPKIIRLENNLDPDDYIVKKGKDAFLNHFKNLMSPISFKMDVNKDGTDFNDYKQISNYISKVALELEKEDDKVVRELIIKKLSNQTGIDIDTINSLVKKQKNDTIITKPKINTLKTKYEKAEEYLIYYMLRSADAILLYQNNISYLNNRNLSKIAVLILEFYQKNHYINVTDFTLFLEDDELLINEVLKIDLLELPDTVTTDIIKDYIKTIEDGIIKKEISKLKNQIKEEVNVAKKVVLLEKLANIKKKECK